MRPVRPQDPLFFHALLKLPLPPDYWPTCNHFCQGKDRATKASLVHVISASITGPWLNRALTAVGWVLWVGTWSLWVGRCVGPCFGSVTVYVSVVVGWSLRMGCCASVAVDRLLWVGRCQSVAVGRLVCQLVAVSVSRCVSWSLCQLIAVRQSRVVAPVDCCVSVVVQERSGPPFVFSQFTTISPEPNRRLTKTVLVWICNENNFKKTCSNFAP